MEGGWENNIKKKEDLAMPSHDPDWQPPGNDGSPRESLDFSQDSPSVSKEHLWYGELLTCLKMRRTYNTIFLAAQKLRKRRAKSLSVLAPPNPGFSDIFTSRFHQTLEKIFDTRLKLLYPRAHDMLLAILKWRTAIIDLLSNIFIRV